MAHNAPVQVKAPQLYISALQAMVGDGSPAKHTVQHRLQVHSAMHVAWKKNAHVQGDVRAHNLDNGRRQTSSKPDVSSLKKPKWKKPRRNTLGFLSRQESLIVLPCLCLFQTWTLVPLLNYQRNLQMLWEKNENQYNSKWQLLFYI